MKLKNIIPVLSIMTFPVDHPAGGNADTSQVSYIIGAVIALFILGYLVYSLLKPDKF
jgi:K+-transporting ATPase KdpF subunit